MFLPLFLVSVVAAAPSPAPTPLKVITHVHASAVCTSLHDLVMDKILAASYAKFPQGTNRNVDSLRQRIQNMVDLQRAYANALRSGPAMVLDNQFPNALDSSNFGGGQTADPSLADNPGPVNPDQDTAVSGYVPARPLVAKDLRTVPASSLARDLFTEENALMPAALAAIRDCDAPEP